MNELNHVRHADIVSPVEEGVAGQLQLHRNSRRQGHNLDTRNRKLYSNPSLKLLLPKGAGG